MTYWIGVDLGQANDYTAVAVLQDLNVETGLYTSGGRKKAETFYHLRHLQRFDLGTSYPTITRKLTALVDVPEIKKEGYYMYVDAGGPGRPVLDMMLEAGLFCWGIAITGGDKPGEGTRPKRDLIGSVQVLLQGGRLKIANSIPDAETLVQELLNYRVKIDPITAHDGYDARTGTHDDLVLALSLACYHALQYCGWGDPSPVEALT
jgi:Terminase RNaseH-like domain